MSNRLQAIIDKHRAKMAALGGKTINFNINRLKHDNAGGYTQRELAQSTIDSAKASGREIERAR